MGHVKIQLTTLAVNAAVSGIFFDLQAPPDFLPSASPSLRSVARGGNTTYDLTVTSLAGFNGVVNLTASGLPTGATASFSPSSVMGSGTSTMTVTTASTTPGGSYPVTITGTSGSLSHPMLVTLVVTVTVPSPAMHIKTDTTTQGTWKGVYGADGYAIAGHATSYPAYAQVSMSGQSQYTWAASTTDTRALQKVATVDRIASTWYSAGNFTFDVNLTDGNWHQVGIYCVDFDNWNRSQRIDILDAVSGNILDTRSLSGFQNGRYLVWNLMGHVKIQLTTLAVNAVVSGIFFDVAQPAFALSVTPDSRTISVGGSANYDVTILPSGGFNELVNLNASGLPVGATASFSPSSVLAPGVSTLTVTAGGPTPTGSHAIAVNAVSSGLTRSVTVTMVVTIPNSAAATFVRTDTATQGTWKGIYGADGYTIATQATNYPAYAQVSISGQSEYTWSGSTSDVRALQKPTAADRIASTWYSGTNFAIDLNLTDGNLHQVGIYCVDFDNWARVQRVDILDSSTGNVLDSRTVSAFQGGRYLVWNMSGHVKIQLTTLAVNAVVSGIFFR
jgi:hypothetical protein